MIRQKTREQRTMINFENIKIIKQQIMAEKMLELTLNSMKGRIDCTFSIAHCWIEKDKGLQIDKNVFVLVILCQ